MKKIIFLFVLFIINSCQNDRGNNVIEISTKKQQMEGIKMYNFYRKDGSLEKTLEYINLCGKEYLNQGFYFNESKDTLFDKSNFYKIYIEKKVLNTNEVSKIIIEYEPLLKNSVSGLLLSKDNIDLDFCNLEKSKLDTIFFIDNKIEFYQRFKNKGIKRLGGYILEIDKNLNNKIYDERKVYLTIPFDVR
jgi:hypothetical protein